MLAYGDHQDVRQCNQDWTICGSDELMDNRHAEWIILKNPNTYGPSWADFLHRHIVKRENMTSAASEFAFTYFYFLISATNLTCTQCGQRVPEGVETIARLLR